MSASLDSHDDQGDFPSRRRVTKKNLIKPLVPRPIWDWLRECRARRALTSCDAKSELLGRVDASWRSRIDTVLASPDNDKIPRCSNAGVIEGHAITMHNGVQVCANGYYGSGILNMLVENRGVHEPQEEYAFEEIVRLLPERPTMI
jgi:hypothetical protein